MDASLDVDMVMKFQQMMSMLPSMDHLPEQVRLDWQKKAYEEWSVRYIETMKKYGQIKDESSAPEDCEELDYEEYDSEEYEEEDYEEYDYEDHEGLAREGLDYERLAYEELDYEGDDSEEYEEEEYNAMLEAFCGARGFAMNPDACAFVPGTMLNPEPHSVVTEYEDTVPTSTDDEEGVDTNDEYIVRDDKGADTDVGVQRRSVCAADSDDSEFIPPDIEADATDGNAATHNTDEGDDATGGAQSSGLNEWPHTVCSRHDQSEQAAPTAYLGIADARHGQKRTKNNMPKKQRKAKDNDSDDHKKQRKANDNGNDNDNLVAGLNELKVAEFENNESKPCGLKSAAPVCKRTPKTADGSLKMGLLIVCVILWMGMYFGRVMVSGGHGGTMGNDAMNGKNSDYNDATGDPIMNGDASDDCHYSDLSGDVFWQGADRISNMTSVSNGEELGMEDSISAITI
eukprot:TRINITY_DN8175_c0_g1_i1.p1 TRINITY_DN8175_c0_g1~~TRINITY_DN8175_c0_g1_i1.p1  ORF type:complete len:457 (+),score=95.84 TRINITY_DN8175_c0_g1_i1:145-1515(+)